MSRHCLYLTVLLWSVVSPEIYLYDTHSVQTSPRLKFNCLPFVTSADSSSSLITEFCLRPSNEDDNGKHWWSEGIPSADDRKYTFDQLVQLNITTMELLSWSTSADLAEEYQKYLNHQDSRLASKEIYKCTPNWFGSRCQYSLDLSQNYPSHYRNILEAIDTRKSQTFEERTSRGSCYTLPYCEDNGEPVCLHWNQICDGEINCIDGGEDEALCFHMEVNECQSNEYRCHNGQCIPERFNNYVSINCLDQSDVLDSSDSETHPIRTYYDDWRDFMCPLGDRKFTCDDGRCVQDFEQCSYAESSFLDARILSLGKLTVECWTIIACLTRSVGGGIDGVLCSALIQSRNISKFLSSCNPLIQFPTKPIILHHVRLLYRRDDLLNHSLKQIVLPVYICFNPELCEHLSPTFHYQNLSCRTASDMGLNISHSKLSWTPMINIIRPYFYGCLSRAPKKEDRQHPSLYCCQNSSKCISQHRILDGIIDCPYHDDELAFALSCTIKDPHRFRCGDKEKCYSPVVPRTICFSAPYLEMEDILFSDICNGVVDIRPQLIDEQNHTDETDCQAWPCSSNMPRCDLFWHCPNGEDEIDCDDWPACPNHTLLCLSQVTHDVICLPAQKVGDRVIDCIGANDEPTPCRRRIDESMYIHGAFLCINDTKCLMTSQICDSYKDCSQGEDELFCDHMSDVCFSPDHGKMKEIANILCQISLLSVSETKFELPALVAWQKNDDIVPAPRNVPPPPIQTRITTMPLDDETFPYCNHGLPVLVRLAPTLFRTRCFCPPDYYGDRCQYQSQRISVTLQVRPSAKKRSVQAILATLNSYDHGHEEIHSHHLIKYIFEKNPNECEKIFRFHLLYSTRLKNISKDYFVKIDVFDQITFARLGSWRYPIPFLFLPVNPMVLVIHIPTQPFPTPHRCPLSCGTHGRCMKYLNTEEFFCRCDSTWTGKRCDQVVYCADCASNSLCLGSIRNQTTICLCAMNIFGPRCLLEGSCPNSQCHNGGTCMMNHLYEDSESYDCVCTEEFSSINFCERRKETVTISFQDMKSASHVVIFSDASKAATESRYQFHIVFAQRLRIFQNSVTLYSIGKPSIVIVLVDDNYFIAAVDKQTKHDHWKMSISPEYRCPLIQEVAPAPWINLPRIQRIKYFHQLCQVNLNLPCFIGDDFLCQCLPKREAYCARLTTIFGCEENVFCLNGGRCIQGQLQCMNEIFCLCSDCFFGDRCQFYAKGLGLTLDDMLRYELRPATSFDQQTLAVKISSALTLTLFVIGLVNSILALMTFRSSTVRQVGVGIYLCASSISSLFTIILLNLKFWFLIGTHIYSSVSRPILRAGCLVLEPTLRLSLFIDNWLNACVAIERSITIFKGVNFNKQLSRRLARWMIMILPCLICMSLIHELVYRDLFYDEEEKRHWCILEYSAGMMSYSTLILSFHTLAPFSINIISAFYIITQSARRRVHARHGETFRSNFRRNVKEHRQLIISPLVLATLSLPRVIISSLTECVKTYRNPYLFLFGYFISFFSSITVFIVFVLPSPLYKEEFGKSIQSLQQGIRNQINAVTRRS